MEVCVCEIRISVLVYAYVYEYMYVYVFACICMRKCMANLFLGMCACRMSSRLHSIHLWTDVYAMRDKVIHTRTHTYIYVYHMHISRTHTYTHTHINTHTHTQTYIMSLVCCTYGIFLSLFFTFVSCLSVLRVCVSISPDIPAPLPRLPCNASCYAYKEACASYFAGVYVYVYTRFVYAYLLCICIKTYD